MEFLFGLLIAIVSAYICYVIAERNGMNKIGWPIFGFLFPLIGLVVTLIVAMSRQKV